MYIKRQARRVVMFLPAQNTVLYDYLDKRYSNKSVKLLVHKNDYSDQGGMYVIG